MTTKGQTRKGEASRLGLRLELFGGGGGGGGVRTAVLLVTVGMLPALTD